MKAGVDAAVVETKVFRGCRSLSFELWRLGLGEVDEFGVVAEVQIAQLWMAADAKTVEHNSIEVSGQEVCEVERGGVSAVHRVESSDTCVHLVAVLSRQTLRVQFGADRIDFSGGSAVGVTDEDVVVEMSNPAQLGPKGIRNLARPVV